MQKEIIILDNQDLTRAGIITLINEVTSDVSISEVTTKSQLVDKLRQHCDACVILDYLNSDITDSEALVHLADKFNKVQWLVVSTDISESMARRLSHFTAFGLVQKNSFRNEIMMAISSTLSHQRYICQNIMDILLSSETKSKTISDELTPTEVEVLRLIALGNTVKEIATERCSSVHTITTHKRSIFRKLHVNTTYEAIRVAIKAGVVDLIEYYI